MKHGRRRVPGVLVLLPALLAVGPPCLAEPEAEGCAAARPAPLTPSSLGTSPLCRGLEETVRQPSALPQDQYEARLGEYLRAFCHRNAAAGWKRDKGLRDTGPYTATLQDGEWVGQYHGTHAPVIIWYSPQMVAWMKTNRPVDESAAPADPEPIPDGAVIVKEMYPPPASRCADEDPLSLLPMSGAAVMVRDRGASHDGWFWGWFGWSGWAPDWPPGPRNPYPNMGFGQYCLNCHASAQDNSTFSSLRNVEGEAGEPLVFLSQHFFEGAPLVSHHRLVTLPTDDAPRLGQPRHAYDPAFTGALPATSLPRPTWGSVSRMPSETYDNAWVSSGGPTAADEFLTSDQCIGCHDAGSTGLQFDMTEPNPEHQGLLSNLSPYATWKTSPMGLGGRDPIFYAQLASETETFHPGSSELIQDTCLGCHGVLGQRQHAIDRFEADGKCDPFLRKDADAVPWPAGNHTEAGARYGALARDGISCTACHRMQVGVGDEDAERPENHCVEERQQLLNPDNTGFARTFTGSFLVGPPTELYGPFGEPKTKPMENALGMEPRHSEAVRSSEMCGSCHTVHLPVMYRDRIIDSTYEQTTYPEWAFSDYRTGETPQGPLPKGKGRRAESCQGCHMPSRDEKGQPYRSKIASIQEYSNFPQAEYNLGPEDVDLEVREGFARHTLVGLNVFFIKMAQQFPDVLGIRTQDPMLTGKGVDPLLLTEQAMLDQASEGTASVAIDAVQRHGERLTATVKVTSATGHKFPSGVGFRRAFLEFNVLDEIGDVIWASGRTNAAGVIVDEAGRPIAGELWWTDDCSERLGPGELAYQPHYQVVRAQDQAQIYQELVTAPAPVAEPTCGDGPEKGSAFTTSFLSICGHVKDNRILPHGFLPLEDRVEIAEALGAQRDMAEDAGPHAVGDDPDYVSGGGDSVRYEVELSNLKGSPTAVQATLYYQATPPYFLQDRFCTSQSEDTQRLYFLAGHLNLDGTAAESWKLEVVSTGAVPVR